ncbi:MAG: 2,5-diketo-D-gluconate reductase [Pseudonocardiales bacterium]|jgi:2,5-diketo-D-gluconate reductase A|nr:2,5-diketo-D-gluconate reductase [Pseudonocardiales bacterium]
MTTVPSISLNNGVQIPQLGFGVFQIKPEDTVEAVTEALRIGYRHIDTAQMYGNEKQVGQAIARSELDPSEIFVTSKLNNNRQSFDDALRAFDQSLADLGLDRVDLFLIHWPLATVRDFTEAWRALERAYSEGRVRSIGVSNFQPHHLRRLHAETEVPPAVNQIEAHPYLVQDEVRAFNAEHQIATEAWSPIAQGLVLDDPAILELAQQHDRTPAQLVLRWHIQLGNIVFPKSINPKRMQENFDLFDFELSETDLGMISSLNRDQRTGPDPDTFDYVPS